MLTPFITAYPTEVTCKNALYQVHPYTFSAMPTTKYELQVHKVRNIKSCPNGIQTTKRSMGVNMSIWLRVQIFSNFWDFWRQKITKFTFAVFLISIGYYTIANRRLDLARGLPKSPKSNSLVLRRPNRLFLLGDLGRAAPNPIIYNRRLRSEIGPFSNG